MVNTRAAVRYAKAILDIANTNDTANAVNSDMLSIASSIANNAELKMFIASPVIKDLVKFNAISEVFTAAQAETKGLFQLLLNNSRFEILETVATQYTALFNELNNEGVATVTTAFPITAEIEKQVQAKIATFSNKKVHLKNKIDPSIIGGFILQLDDKQYNASVKNRLAQLKIEFNK